MYKYLIPKVIANENCFYFQSNYTYIGITYIYSYAYVYISMYIYVYCDKKLF